MSTEIADGTRSDRAVSTMVGVAIAVAVVAVLAGVAVFVLGVGDVGDSTPSPSVEAAEEVVFLDSGNHPAQKNNLTQATLSHTGGETIGVARLQIAHNGNTSVWAPTDGTNELGSGEPKQLYEPQPDFCSTLPGREAKTFGPGDSLYAVASGGEFTNGVVAGDAHNGKSPKMFSDANFPNVKAGGEPEAEFLCSESLEYYGYIRPNGKFRWEAFKPGQYRFYRRYFGSALMAGDTIELVWEAESGNSTTTLFEYTVQQDSPSVP